MFECIVVYELWPRRHMSHSISGAFIVRLSVSGNALIVARGATNVPYTETGVTDGDGGYCT